MLQQLSEFSADWEKLQAAGLFPELPTTLQVTGPILVL